MRIIQLDLPVLKEYSMDESVTNVFCGRMTENDLPSVQDFLLHNGIGLSDKKLTAEDVFCLTVFKDDSTHIVGLLGLNNEQVDFQKYGMPNIPMIYYRVFHNIEYLITDKRLFDETLLKHAIQIALHSVVDKEDNHEEVLWFEHGNNLYAKVIDKCQKQYGYYFEPEAKYFAEAIVYAFNMGTCRYNELLAKVK